MPEFRVKEDGMQQRALESRAKIQVIGGGYGNGKSAVMCSKAIQIGRYYPGANILMARSTYPKLNDTLRKEYIKWMPKRWIKSFPLSKNGSNTCTWRNETQVNFRYIAQQGKQQDDGHTTSNLLSATYDLICVDQIEDPEIEHKDFLDMLGRLRGSAAYIGDDPTMPLTGPRWMIVALNPTRSWPYLKIVKPLHHFMKTGEVDDDLLCVRDSTTNKPILDDKGNVQLLVELFEAPTYENKHNLDADFIQTLESAYTGSAKERFLLGKWAAYEGLVYPDFDDELSGVSEDNIKGYINFLASQGYSGSWEHTYDFGISQPSCYLLWYTDPFGNQFVVDGFYEKEFSIYKQSREMHRLIRTWGAWGLGPICADPDIFRRKVGDSKQPGKSVVDVFNETDPTISFRRANNNITAGVLRVQEYINYHQYHRHPITGDTGAPYFFYNNKLDFIRDEFGAYYWKKRTDGESEDKPIDKNDHALDNIRYRLVECDHVANIAPQQLRLHIMHQWHETPDTTQENGHRYG